MAWVLRPADSMASLREAMPMSQIRTSPASVSKMLQAQGKGECAREAAGRQERLRACPRARKKERQERARRAACGAGGATGAESGRERPQPLDWASLLFWLEVAVMHAARVHESHRVHDLRRAARREAVAAPSGKSACAEHKIREGGGEVRVLLSRVLRATPCRPLVAPAAQPAGRRRAWRRQRRGHAAPPGR